MCRAHSGADRHRRAACAAADGYSGAVRRRNAHAGRARCAHAHARRGRCLPKVNTGSWELTLVNAQNPIGEAVPEDLAELEGGRYFDGRAVDALKEFIAAARAEGLSVCLSSTYRSYSEQSYLFTRKVGQCGGDEAAAARIVTRPGTSEHQLGLCADITDKFYEVKTRDLEKTALFQWMYAHCQEYGFILRYPADKESVTGVMYEPWHFRYVGKEAAAYIMENNLCLEEFLDLYK